MLKAHGLVPVVAGVKRRADSSLDDLRVKTEDPEVDEVDAQIKALEVTCLMFGHFLVRY